MLFDESIFSMKEAIKARQHTIIEDPIVTFDYFPPDDGTYSVSYDFHLLDCGFNTVQKNTTPGTYICVPKKFPRCRITVTQVQLDDLLRSMHERLMTRFKYSSCSSASNNAATFRRGAGRRLRTRIQNHKDILQD